jgi:adenylate kinase family enzyme
VKKVILIGSPGAGKSTFSKKMAKLTGLPLYHLDALYWKPNWVETSKDEWDEKLRNLVLKPAWILDGNYGRTLEIRIKAADTIIWLNKPRMLCIWRVIKRRLTNFGRVRSDMGEDCVEKLRLNSDFLKFLLYIWRFPKKSGQNLEERLHKFAGEGTGKKVIILRADLEAESYLTLLEEELKDQLSIAREQLQ